MPWPIELHSETWHTLSCLTIMAFVMLHLRNICNIFVLNDDICHYKGIYVVILASIELSDRCNYILQYVYMLHNSSWYKLLMPSFDISISLPNMEFLRIYPMCLKTLLLWEDNNGNLELPRRLKVYWVFFLFWWFLLFIVLYCYHFRTQYVLHDTYVRSQDQFG